MRPGTELSSNLVRALLEFLNRALQLIHLALHLIQLGEQLSLGAGRGATEKGQLKSIHLCFFLPRARSQSSLSQCVHIAPKNAERCIRLLAELSLALDHTTRVTHLPQRHRG